MFMTREPLTTLELNGLLHMATEKHKLDPEKTYVEFTWWKGVFKPLVDTDCSHDTSSYVMVFGENPCNFWKSFRHNGEHIPCGFYVLKDMVWPDRVVHRPITVSHIMDSAFMMGFKYAKFLFSSSPVNYYVDANPYKTCVYKNWANETILCFYADDRDSGEWKSISRMKADDVRLVDDSPSRFGERSEPAGGRERNSGFGG